MLLLIERAQKFSRELTGGFHFLLWRLLCKSKPWRGISLLPGLLVLPTKPTVTDYIFQNSQVVLPPPNPCWVLKPVSVSRMMCLVQQLSEEQPPPPPHLQSLWTPHARPQSPHFWAWSTGWNLAEACQPHLLGLQLLPASVFSFTIHTIFSSGCFSWSGFSSWLWGEKKMMLLLFPRAGSLWRFLAFSQAAFLFS